MNKSIIYGIVGLVVGALLSGTVVANQMSTSTDTAKSETTPTTVMPENDSMQGMNHGGMSMDQMSMADMMTELDGKMGDDFDKVFLQSMIAHHQGAIDMANAAKERSGHDELKQMADEIISAQDSEIKQMQQWQKEWGYTQ